MYKSFIKKHKIKVVRVKSGHITLLRKRINREVLRSIDEFAKTMAEDRSTVIRHLIKKAISEEKIEIAVKNFQSGVPFRKAAESAGLDYWDFQSELDKRGIPVTGSLSLARKRM